MQSYEYLVCALSDNEFYRVLTCKSAKEILQILKVTHEGTIKLKTPSKFTYTPIWTFWMDPNETIENMFTRFTSIINVIKCLGKEYAINQLVNSILRLEA